MSKARRTSLWLLAAAGLAFLLVLFFRAEPLTEETARRFAQERFERYGASVGLDVATFGSPIPIPAARVPYGFEWTYRDDKGEIRVIVWVDEGGWTDIAIDGEIERLFKDPPPGPPAKA